MTEEEAHRAAAEQFIAEGRTALLAGDQATAERLLDQALKLYEQIGDSYAIAAQIGNYGWALRRAGQPTAARPYLQQAAERFAAMGMDDFAERHRSAAEDADYPLLTGEVLAGLPPAVRGALERGDGAALEYALNALPLAEQQLVFERLIAAGIISDPAAADSSEVLSQFAPLIEVIVAVARGDSSERADVEAALHDLEQKGWFFSRVIPLIWAGQRDPAHLTRGLDEIDTTIVRHILELL